MKISSLAQKLTLSSLVIALYVTVMMLTQSFAFGQYQVRIATSLYALSGIFPFLTLPLGFANFLSNTLMGGLGPLDMAGGIAVGILTAGSIAFFKDSPRVCRVAFLSIALIPGLGVPLWLSWLLHIPYVVLMPSVLVGQVSSGAFGALLLSVLKNRFKKQEEQRTL